MSKFIGRLSGLVVLGSIISVAWILQGCAHHAYKPQTITVRGSHTLTIHESLVAVENAYELAWAKTPDKKNKLVRNMYGGFFDPVKNHSHCYTPWPEECMRHEYKHQLVKYGLIVPDDPHFKNIHN